VINLITLLFPVRSISSYDFNYLLLLLVINNICTMLQYYVTVLCFKFTFFIKKSDNSAVADQNKIMTCHYNDI